MGGTGPREERLRHKGFVFMCSVKSGYPFCAFNQKLELSDSTES